MKALLDADIIAYRAAAIADRDDLPAWACIQEACNMAEEWMRMSGANDLLMVFSPENRGNYRKHLDNTYKDHRSEKPAVYDELVHTLKQRYPFYFINGLEADDVMGILQTSDVTGETCIVSIDKDMLTIPGTLFNPNKMSFADEITELQADYNWLYQTLVGDTADGFKGCPGIGPKNAAKALDDCLTANKGELLQEIDHGRTNIPFSAMWSTVVELFRAKSEGIDAEALAIQNARMARILRRSDYDSENGLVRLFHPETPQAFSLETMQVVGDWTL